MTIALISIAFVGILERGRIDDHRGCREHERGHEPAAVRNLGRVHADAGLQALRHRAGRARPPMPTSVSAVTPPGYVASVERRRRLERRHPGAFVKGPDGTSRRGHAGVSSAGGDHGLELLTLSIAPPNGQLGAVATRTITVLKRTMTKPTPRAELPDEGGFTLIEVLVAIPITVAHPR